VLGPSSVVRCPFCVHVRFILHDAHLCVLAINRDPQLLFFRDISLRKFVQCRTCAGSRRHVSLVRFPWCLVIAHRDFSYAAHVLLSYFAIISAHSISVLLPCVCARSRWISREGKALHPGTILRRAQTAVRLCISTLPGNLQLDRNDYFKL